MSRRGYVPEDEKQFTGKQLALLKKAAEACFGKNSFIKGMDSGTQS